MQDVSALIIDPVSGLQRVIRAGEQLVDGDGNPLSIEVGHTPVNYTPVGADPTDLNAHLAGIDAILPDALQHDTADIISGTFADARIAESNVTQHNAALDHGTLLGNADDDHPQYGGSTGVASGCDVTDGGAGTFDVAAGVVNLRTTDSNTGELIRLNFAGATGEALTDQALNYIYIQYNGGVPNISTVLTSTAAFDRTLIATVYRDGATLHITPIRPLTNNTGREAAAYNAFTEGLVRQDGLIISETGTRNLAVSAGAMWLGLERTAQSAFDSSVADTFSYYYQDGVGGFTEVTVQAQIDNANYDDGSGTLAALTTNRYGVHWVYMGIDGDVYVIYGRGDYVQAQAEAAQPPSNLPGHFDDWHVMLLGKIVIKESAASFFTVESAFTEKFVGVTVSDHGALAGLSDDDHAQYALLAGRTGGQTLSGSDITAENLTLRANAADLTGSVLIPTTTVSTTPTTGALQVTGGVGIAGSVFIGTDLDVTGDAAIGGKLTVTGLIDPTGMQFDPQAANPGDPFTIWVRTADGALMLGENVIGGSSGGVASIVEGTSDGQMAYWDEAQQLWLPALGLDWDDATQVFRIGDGIGSSATPVPGATFTVDAATGDVYMAGKLTVDGLIDPTGMQFVPQVSNPGDANTIWVDQATSDLMLGAGQVGVTVHSDLTGLTSDDHSQYLYLPGGRTGEQRIVQIADGANGATQVVVDADPNGRTQPAAFGVHVKGENMYSLEQFYGIWSNVAHSSNGSIGYSFVASASGERSANKPTGLLVGPEMHVISQLPTSPGAVQNAFTFAGSAFTDVTASFNSTGVNTTIFVNNGDYIYIGNSSQFSSIDFRLLTPATESMDLAIQYSAGASAWNTLQCIDTTENMQHSGAIIWDVNPAGWATDTVNGVAGRYWIRIQRTAATGTGPTETLVNTALSPTTAYGWDSAGVITAYQTVMADGAAASPTYTFTNATGSGMYWAYGPGLGFSDGGSTVLTINSSLADFSAISGVSVITITDDNNNTAIDLGTSISPLRHLKDLSNSLSLNWEQRVLVDSFGNNSISYESRAMYSSNGSTITVDWLNQALQDSGSNVSVDWQSRYMNDNYTQTSLNWLNRQLIATDGFTIAVDWNNRTLNEFAGNTTVDWGNQALVDSSGFNAIDWANRALANTSGSASVVWNDADGFYINTAAARCALAMDRTSAPGAPLTAAGGIIYFDSVSGDLRVQFAGGSDVQIVGFI